MTDHLDFAIAANLKARLCEEREHERLVQAFASCTDELRLTTVVLTGATHVIFKTRGHSYWSSVGSRSYAPTEYTLIRKGIWCLARDRTTKGTYLQWVGRVKMTDLQAALDEAELNQAKVGD